jgi:hypothetical protein
MRSDQCFHPLIVKLNFHHPKLLKRYGTWVAVQVAFYDFIFQSAMQMHSGCIKEQMIAEWKDGGDPYEKAKANIELKYLTADAAWKAFLAEEKV